MYNEELKCGILGDYDLSAASARIPGTGTMPFMAVGLLTDKYWDGKIECLYRHVLEAFIWILPFVFLRYQDGKAQRGTPVERWMTSNYHTCQMEKNNFWTPDMMVQWSGFCLPDFKDLRFLPPGPSPASDLVRDLGRAQIIRAEGMGTVSEDEYSVALLWPLFVEQLRLAASKFSSRIGFINKLIDNLELEKLFW